MLEILSLNKRKALLNLKTSLIVIVNDGIPGLMHSPSLQETVFLSSPEQVPPPDSSTDFVRVFVWVPSPQVTEQAE